MDTTKNSLVARCHNLLAGGKTPFQLIKTPENNIYEFYKESGIAFMAA